MLVASLPYASRHATLMKCLLAVAARLRSTCTDNADLDVIAPYQVAVTELRQKLAQIAAHPAILPDEENVGLLACCLVLTFFGFDQADGTWCTHILGSHSILEHWQNCNLDSSPEARRVREEAAHVDISAFTIGKHTSSREAWLHWLICPVDADGIPTDCHERARTEFTVLEITTGYPKSLLTIIAMLSRLVDSQASKRRSLSTMASDFRSLNQAITGWRPPHIPPNLGRRVASSLIPAWETIRKAAIIFLLRGCGFHSDVTLPLNDGDATLVMRYTNEILFAISALVKLAQTSDVNIANGMLWPLMVASNEISGQPGLQGLALEIISNIEMTFGLAQMKHIRLLLNAFWEQGLSTRPGTTVSLEGTARAMSFSIPVY